MNPELANLKKTDVNAVRISLIESVREHKSITRRDMCRHLGLEPHSIEVVFSNKVKSISDQKLQKMESYLEIPPMKIKRELMKALGIKGSWDNALKINLIKNRAIDR